jgi:3-deoxy-D-manno-octulosonic-acid transferase
MLTRLLYNIVIRLYGMFLHLAAMAGHPKAKQWVTGRRNWEEKLAESIQGGPWVWFHCASLGEFEQGRPLLEAFRRLHPEKKILLTFFSPSGYEIRKDYREADYVAYLPLDTRGNAARFVEIVRPECVFFIKYEYWFNFLNACNRTGIPVYLVSSLFRKGQWFFGPLAGSFLKELASVKHYFVQDKESADLLRSKGIGRVTVSGDTRFDRVKAIAEAGEKLEWLESWKGAGQLLVAGSTWPEDERLLAEYVSGTGSGTRLLLVPHETGENHLKEIDDVLKKHGLTAAAKRLSSITGMPDAGVRIIVVDRIGLLSRCYRYATAAYIGGGFGAGIHNTLEAAVFGIPVVFGPNYLKFKEARDLVQLKAAVSITDYRSLAETLDTWLTRPDTSLSAGRIGGEYVSKQAGATARILSEL